MAYRLQNIATGTVFACEDGAWHRALAAAKDEGWHPAGSRYDFEFQLDEYCDHKLGSMMNLYIVLQLHMDHVNWKGSYTDRENQIVTDDDAAEFHYCLRAAGVEPAILAFIDGGAFRICE